MDQSRITILENVIKQMLRPLKGLPFDLVLESMTGHKLLKITDNDAALIEKIDKAACIVAKDLLKKPIISRRANEVGNAIEAYVRAALTQVNLKVETPAGKSGKQKATGYPDLLIYENDAKPTYLECKTFSEENSNTTLRAFYLSPSDDFKVSLDARHLLIAFEMEVKGNSYTAKGYKLLSLENLLLDVKYEFNASNRGLYKETRQLIARNF